MGDASSHTTITNCYNTNTVTGSGAGVGGVVGIASGTITNCYNTGAVTGSSNVGGVVGIASGTITNCYYGVNCPSTVGGKDGANVPGQAEHSTTLTANSPKELAWYTTSSNWDSSYAWDFDFTWQLESNVNDGYPTLKDPIDWWIDKGNYSIEWFTNAQSVEIDGTTYQSGTEQNPYIIASAEDLAGLSWLVYTKGRGSNPLVEGTDYSENYIFQGKFFKQTVDIDLSAYYWQPIGINYTREGTTRYNYFSGSYDGNYHTISRLSTPSGTTNAYSNQGLFGYVESSSSSYPITIQNIGIVDSDIQGSSNVGGVV